METLTPIPNNSTSSSTNKEEIILITVDEAIEKVTAGKFQKILLFATGCCMAADSMEMMMLAFLSTVLKDEWNLSYSQAAGIVSAVFFGAMCGTLTLGSLGDVYGRRPIFLIAAGIVTVFGFATALCDSYEALLIMRGLTGFGVGGLTVPFDILAEFSPLRIRGKYLLYIEYFWGLGSLTMPIVAYCTIGSGYSWKLFVLLCAVPCLIGLLVGYYCVPESSHWLVSQGRNDEALDILKKAGLINGLKIHEIFPPNVRLQHEQCEHASFKELFKPKWFRLTMTLFFIWFGLAFSYYGCLLSITRVFEVDENDDDDDDVSFDYLSIFISAIADIIGVALVACTVDTYGRVFSQAIFYLLGGVVLYFVCLLSSLPVSNIFLTILAFFARLFCQSAVCCTWVAAAELFGTEVRTTGHSSANAVSRFGGMIVPFIVESSIPLPIVGAILLVFHTITVLFVLLTPETNGMVLGKARHNNNDNAVPLLHNEYIVQDR